MANANPTISISVSEVLDSTKLSLLDTTGQYNVVTNPTGYNAGVNISDVDVTSLLIKVYTPRTTVPWIYTFTIVANTITVCTLTSPSLAVETIDISTFPSTDWPFIDEESMPILATDLDYATAFEDGHYIVEYIIAGAYAGPTAFTFTTSVDLLLVGNAKCCIMKMFLKADSCDCGCKELEKAINADGFLTAAIYAANLGLIDDAVVLLNKATELCDGNCDDCN